MNYRTAVLLVPILPSAA